MVSNTVFHKSVIRSEAFPSSDVLKIRILFFGQFRLVRVEHLCTGTAAVPGRASESIFQNAARMLLI